MASKKRILIVRHGQSEWNLAQEQEDGANSDETPLWDAALTEEGQWQASTLYDFLEDEKIDYVISSPLSRALQTCLLAYPPQEHPNITYHVDRNIRESISGSDDIGSTPSMLAEKFPMFDFSELPEVWWYSKFQTLAEARKEYLLEENFNEPRSLVMERLRNFYESLLTLPYDNILVFGHCNIFHKLMRIANPKIGYYQSNCEVVEIFPATKKMKMLFEPGCGAVEMELNGEDSTDSDS